MVGPEDLVWGPQHEVKTLLPKEENRHPFCANVHLGLTNRLGRGWWGRPVTLRLESSIHGRRSFWKHEVYSITYKKTFSAVQCTCFYWDMNLWRVVILHKSALTWAFPITEVTSESELYTCSDFHSCFASSSWLGGAGLRCGRSWISLLAGIIEWAVKMIKDSSDILPLGDKWWERQSERERMCEMKSTQRQGIFQCQLTLVCIVDCHWLWECKSGQITNVDTPDHCFALTSPFKAVLLKLFPWMHQCSVHVLMSLEVGCLYATFG